MESRKMQCDRIILSTAMLLLAVLCDKNPSQPGMIPVSLKITVPSSVICSGGTFQFRSMAVYTDETSRDVTDETLWSVIPGHAGSMKNGGLFIASIDSVGEEIIRADYQGETDTVKIQVIWGARSFVVWPVTVMVPAGGETQFEAIVEFSGPHQDYSSWRDYVTDEAEWSVSPGSAGTIDQSGFFTAKPGMTGLETVLCKYQNETRESRVVVQESAVIPFEMVLITGGPFIMGDDLGESHEKPAHEVYIGAYEIGQYEITNAQYADYLNQALDAGDVYYDHGIVTATNGPFSWMSYLRVPPNPDLSYPCIEYRQIGSSRLEFRANPGFEQYPVVGLNWSGATAFCAYYGLRLPTEAEWEKACRGGQRFDYGTLDGSITHDLVNFRGTGGIDVYDGLAPVGSFPPNPYGMYDMSGNAAELLPAKSCSRTCGTRTIQVNRDTA